MILYGDKCGNKYTKSREIPGPAPYSYGLIAKPNKKTTLSSIVLEKRRKEDELLEIIKQTKKDELKAFTV